jgi:hypothetical protein
MYEISPVLSQIPPQIPGAVPLIPSLLPLGQNPEDREPIPHPVAAVEAMLRQPRRIISCVSPIRPAHPGMLVVTILSSLLWLRGRQFLDGACTLAARESAGLPISALICLPSPYSRSAGSPRRLTESCGWVVGLLMLMTPLIGFAPVAGCLPNPPNRLCGWARFIWPSGSSPPVLGWLLPRACPLRLGPSLIARLGGYPLVVVQMTTALRPMGNRNLLPGGEEIFATAG